MKKLFYLPMASLMILFSSCDFDFDFNIIPDFDDVVDEIFTINIDSDLTTGFTQSDSLDLTQYDAYEKYKENFTSFEITEVTCEIVEFDAPEDLWFSGTIIAHDMDSTVSVVIAEFDTIHLHKVYNDSVEVDLIEDQAGLSQVSAWMEDPGKFNYHIEYEFVNEDTTPYIFKEEDYGDYFKIKLNFAVLLKTKG